MKTISDIVKSLFYYFVSLFVRRDPKRIAFGSWSGKLFMDNSRYLAEYIKSNYPDYKLFWVGDDEISNEVISSGFVFLKRNSFVANLRLLRCKYFFFTQMAAADISECNVYRKSITCYLHHGVPIKRWGEDAIHRQFNKKKRNVYQKLYGMITANYMKYDYFATSSPLHDKTNLTSLRYRGCTDKKNLKCGTPRNDFLINISTEQKNYYKEKYLKALNIDGKKVLLYLPTFRRKTKDAFSFAKLNEEQSKQLNEILSKNNMVIVEKSHFIVNNTNDRKIDNSSVVFLDKKTNIQEFYVVSDCLISDYSSAFADYLFLNKPIIHFAYDYDYYKDVDSGLYYDIEDFSAGPIAYTFEQFLAEIKNISSGIDLFEGKREYVKNKYMTYEDGLASQHIFEKVVLSHEHKNEGV